ncbi:MAG: hypothetical protein K2M82_05750 [Lachnospiraceae bacterium]|nr:hypothetical protein [Lachnospiraceae bacterium]
MPFINCKMNIDISKQQELDIKSELGKAISLIPGKSENWLMVNIEPKCALYFRGNTDKPTAMVEVTVYGNASEQAYDSLTAQINRILSSVAGIEEMYVSYAETNNFGYNGSNF